MAVDTKYNNLIKRIHEEGVWDKGEKVRTVYADGTPAYTKSIFGVQVEFEEDEVPILTNKKVFWKTALKEILLFWQKQTVQEKDFKESNVKVWDEWFQSGNLGRSYAYQFESHRNHKREIVKIKPKIKEHHGELSHIVVNDRIEKPNKTSTSKYVGQVLDSTKYGKFIVLDSKGSDLSIQFLDTGYKRTLHISNIIQGIGKVRDPYKRVYDNVGYLGELDNINFYKKGEVDLLKNRWYNMIKRCYDENHRDYKLYGGRGVFVCERWHNFTFFLNDIKYLPQFFLARENFDNYQLDKDYFSSNCYSPETCVWLSVSDNNIYKREPFWLIHSNGEKEFFMSQTDAKIKYDLGRHLSTVLQGKAKTHKGYGAEYINNDEGYAYRYELSRNQVIELLHNIKSSPQSRRLMTNFYNFADADKKALVECAYGTTWNVKNERLDLILSQRSADIGLGLPFNWIQYRLLQYMIAQVSGLKAGKFIHQIANLHYYDRHEEILLNQIKNDTYTQPKIWINPNIDDFFNFTPEDIKLVDYECGSYLPMEVAI